MQKWSVRYIFAYYLSIYMPIFKLWNDPYVAVEYQIPQNRQETLKEKLDFYAKLSGLPIFKLGNDPYVAA